MPTLYGTLEVDTLTRLRIGWCAVILAAIMSFPLFGLNHDTAWFLYLAERVIDDAVLYRDFVEVNPPLAIWVLVPAVHMVRGVGLPGWLAPYLLLAIEITASLILTREILAHARSALAPIQRRVLLLAMGMLLVVLIGYEATQREHQTVVLMLPALWCLVFIGTPLPLSLRIASGLLAGVGVAFKPHYCIAWLTIELATAVRDRRLRGIIRSETIAGTGIVLVYAGSVLRWAPEYLDHVRQFGDLYDDVWRRPLAWFAVQPPTLLMFCTMALVAVARANGGLGRAQWVFAVSALAFWGAVLAQHKGLEYHWVPVVVLSGISLSAAWLGASRTQLRRLVALVGAFLLIAPAAGQIAMGTLHGRVQRRVANAIVLATGGHTASEHDLAILSTSIQRAWPAAYYLGLDWPMRYPALWPLFVLGRPDCLGPPPGDTRAAVDQQIRDAVYADLSRAAPRILLVSSFPNSQGDDPSCRTLADYFATEPRFAVLFDQYVPIGTLVDLVVLRRAGP